MKVMVVAGARPNFMKIAPVVAELAMRGYATVLVHTGQHYDTSMSQSFFDDLGIRAPDHFLGVGGGSHAAQTARIMERFEPVLLGARPDWVLVPGDVNSTLGVSLVTVKLKSEIGTRLAHLEAGLRSNDWRMPEEINRVLTDRCSDLLLTPSRDALPNLLKEGISPARIVFIGNVMIDTLLRRIDAARERDYISDLGLQRDNYVAATLHRPSNVDDPDTLRVCLEALSRISARLRVVLPMHPRTRQRAEAFGLGDLLAGLIVTPPLGYLEMLSVTDGARVMMTDSGGLQEETTVLGVPCVTLREQTERPITIEQGTNRLAGWPLTVDGIVASFEDAMARPRRAIGSECPEGWDGRASERLVAALELHLGTTPEGVQ